MRIFYIIEFFFLSFFRLLSLSLSLLGTVDLAWRIQFWFPIDSSSEMISLNWTACKSATKHSVHTLIPVIAFENAVQQNKTKITGQQIIAMEKVFPTIFSFSSKSKVVTQNTTTGSLALQHLHREGEWTNLTYFHTEKSYRIVFCLHYVVLLNSIYMSVVNACRWKWTLAHSLSLPLYRFWRKSLTFNSSGLSELLHLTKLCSNKTFLSKTIPSTPRPSPSPSFISIFPCGFKCSEIPFPLRHRNPKPPTLNKWTAFLPKSRFLSESISFPHFETCGGKVQREFDVSDQNGGRDTNHLIEKVFRTPATFSET